MKVAWVGTFDPTFSRNRRLARLLDLTATEVDIIRMDLWTTDRVATAARGKARALLRGFLVYPRLIWRLLRAPTPDVYLVSYPGWFDVPFVWLVAKLRKRPVVFDPFFLLHETVVEDRDLIRHGSLAARLVAIADKFALRLPDCIIADTGAHLSFYRELTTINAGAILEVGADDSIFRPREVEMARERRVLFYGNFVPLQGSATIVEAARLLADRDVHMTMIGEGQERPHVEALIKQLQIKNVDVLDRVPLEDLPNLIAASTICLGIFGSSPKAERVVPHKVYECLAMGKPVITRGTRAVTETFSDGEVETVDAGPDNLSDAILRLLDDPERRARLARKGLEAYRRRFHEDALAASLGRALELAVESK